MYCGEMPLAGKWGREKEIAREPLHASATRGLTNGRATKVPIAIDKNRFTA
jgi:hypothetical protein